MIKIYKYNDFINEKYMAAPEYRIKKFFKELKKNIEHWFDEGAFGASGAELGQVEILSTHSIEKTLTFEFNDKEFYYQIYVVVSVKDVTEDVLNDSYIRIKKYDITDMTLIRSMGEDVPIDEINEDKLLELISKIDDESSTLKIDGGSVSLSDDDSDLEDTSLV